MPPLFFSWYKDCIYILGFFPNISFGSSIVGCNFSMCFIPSLNALHSFGQDSSNELFLLLTVFPNFFYCTKECPLKYLHKKCEITCGSKALPTTRVLICLVSFILSIFSLFTSWPALPFVYFYCKFQIRGNFIWTSIPFDSQ